MNTKGTLGLALALALAGLQASTAKAGEKWTDVHPGKSGELLEGTYQGKGRMTHQRYYLHVKRYLDRQDLFFTVVENRHTRRAWLGLIERRESGAYDWRPVGVDSVSRRIEAPFSASVDYSWAFEADKKGRLSKFVGSSVSKDVATESVAYWDMRPLKLRVTPSAGVWKMKGVQLSLPYAGQSSFEARLTEQSKDGETASALEVSPTLFPGLFATSRVVESEYERRRADGRVDALLVTIDAHVEVKRLWWDKTVDGRVLYFGVPDSKNPGLVLPTDAPLILKR